MKSAFPWSRRTDVRCTHVSIASSLSFFYNYDQSFFCLILPRVSSFVRINLTDQDAGDADDQDDVPLTKCDICNKGYKGKRGLASHMRVHTKEAKDPS